MAAKSLIQTPHLKHVTLLRSDKTGQHTLFITSLPNSNININTSKSLVISSSSTTSIFALAPQILTSPVASPPISRAPAAGAEATVPLSRVWREIQGSNNWRDLIEPLNPLLQQEITRYGNLVSTCYKAFDLNPNSKRYLNCKYGKKTLLKETGIHQPEDYQVTKYIYATPDINISPIHNEANQCARWVGYVAVSSDDWVKRLGRRDIVVTFRGTVVGTNFLSKLEGLIKLY